MKRTDEEVKKKDAEKLLLKAKEMEANDVKIPVRINSKTILLVSANKLNNSSKKNKDQDSLSKKKKDGRRKL